MENLSKLLNWWVAVASLITLLIVLLSDNIEQSIKYITVFILITYIILYVIKEKIIEFKRYKIKKINNYRSKIHYNRAIEYFIGGNVKEFHNIIDSGLIIDDNLNKELYCLDMGKLYSFKPSDPMKKDIRKKLKFKLE